MSVIYTTQFAVKAKIIEDKPEEIKETISALIKAIKEIEKEHSCHCTLLEIEN